MLRLTFYDFADEHMLLLTIIIVFTIHDMSHEKLHIYGKLLLNFPINDQCIIMKIPTVITLNRIILYCK